MFKDSKGKDLYALQVVCLNNKLYTVYAFDFAVENCVKIANGSTLTQAKPEELTIVTELSNIN